MQLNNGARWHAGAATTAKDEEGSGVPSRCILATGRTVLEARGAGVTGVHPSFPSLLRRTAQWQWRSVAARAGGLRLAERL